MKQICSIIVLLILMPLTVSAQKSTKSFQGILEYRITGHDSITKTLVPDNIMVIYTNDTIVRAENYTAQLGKQITIRHMELNKSYLLLSMGDTMNYAIQTDLNVSNDSVKSPSKYSFKKKWLKKRFNGFKANRIMVSHPNFEEPIEFYYLKNYNTSYLNVFEEIPGLLVKYSLPTADGVLDYELVSMKEAPQNRDLFGIPSNYKRVSFDQFLEELFELEDQQK